MTLTLLSFFISTGLAADANDDGCEDSYFDANSACVSPDASIGSGATVGSNADVQAYASIGADTELQANTFVGARTTLVGRVAASGARPVGSGTVIGRAAFIDADHDIGADNTIGRTVDAGQRLQTGANVTIGFGATLGDDVTINAGATVGSIGTVGNNTQVVANAVLARGVDIADSASSASIGGIIGPNVTIGGNNSIDSTARIRKEATLGNDVTVLGGARIERGAIIADGVTIGANARIGAGATVTATTVVPSGTVVPRGETYDDPSVGNFSGGTLLNQTEMDQINAWVGDPNANWTLCYKRTVDGNANATFNSQCGNRGVSVTVSTYNGKKFGAYSPISWGTQTGWTRDSSDTAFLFSLTNTHKHGVTNDSRWTTHDVYIHNSYGPTFGPGHDYMAIGINGNTSGTYCNLGHGYACRVGSAGNSTCRIDFCGSSGNFSPDEVEVYVHD